MASLQPSVLVMSLLLSSCFALPLAKPTWTSALTLPLTAFTTNNATGSYRPLPTPTGSPKYIGLGLGTQNYTCNSTTNKFVETGSGGGALARLFDATNYLSFHPSQIPSLPKEFLSQFSALPCSQSTSGCFELDGQCEDQADYQWAREEHTFPLPVLGEHFFTANGTPTFDLYNAPGHPYLSSKKAGDEPAPEAGNIDWLYLVSNGSPENNIITSVYRVETAKGVAPNASCTVGQSAFVPYSAEYWFYT